jgi:hypothetical protein
LPLEAEAVWASLNQMTMLVGQHLVLLLLLLPSLLLKQLALHMP